MESRILKSVVLGVLAAISLGSSIADAHDLWLLPPAQSLPGEDIQIRTSSGMEFPKSENLSDPGNYLKRIARGPDGSLLDLTSFSHTDEYGLMQISQAVNGFYVVGVQTSPKTIELGAADFNHYLVSDGLPHIYLLRQSRGWLERPAVEQYSKFPKTLIQVGSGSFGDVTKPLGLTLEIVPLENPFGLQRGETLKVQVLFRGHSLADAHLGWDHEGDGLEVAGTIRTDADGQALIPVSKDGLMSIRLTHMTRPENEKHEWESFWTTLTFRLNFESRNIRQLP